MKKAILVVSFGTSYPKTREKTIGACEASIKAAFPDYDVFRAFTSNMIIKKLKQRDGILVDTVEQALDRLHKCGYEEVIIQSLHIINGEEYEKIIEQARSYKWCFEHLIIGEPLLTSFEDYENTIEALKQHMPSLTEAEAIVLMGHGSDHYAFSAYACLDHMLNNEPIYLGCVESYPELDSVIKALKADGKKRVHLVPFMLVAGDHATNDMASEEKDSWNSILQEVGFETICHLQGLGENPAIQKQFVNRIERAIEKEKPLYV